MTSAPMIEQYLHRLALSEAKGVALVTELIEKHLARYAFSSLNAMAGQPLFLQTDALFERLVVNQQGGYCFEHNPQCQDSCPDLESPKNPAMEG
ncbi:arylamine N-acetyltransferase [Salinivibrio kushneri]|uniref:Uncharacterized protein n=1 Tax=Salinivibrio kushneri TaxID=1908198 RepID=A0AB36K0B2_9GAMM|nr:arylamine N-acetyltransferase [Salinivibrio kushneri]OOE40869.1 hypothetical protein BZG09_16260 [Salinivibrio kushneri]